MANKITIVSVLVASVISIAPVSPHLFGPPDRDPLRHEAFNPELPPTLRGLQARPDADRPDEADLSCEAVPGGVSIGHQCFTIHVDEALNWEDAASSCASRGGRLAIIADQPETVGDYLSTHYGGLVRIWIGGSDHANEGRWFWINGQPFDKQFPWSGGEPNNDRAGEDCLAVNWHFGKFNDLSCSIKLHYMCDIAAHPAHAMAPAIPHDRDPLQSEATLKGLKGRPHTDRRDEADLSCEAGVSIGQQCFTVHVDEALNWEDAASSCASRGGRLAVIADQPETVGDYLSSNYGDLVKFWVGGSDRANEGGWYWINGQPFDKQFPWTGGEPNNAGGGEDCLSVNGHYEKIYAVPCSRKLPYMCDIASQAESFEYKFQWSVSDESSGNHYGHQQARDGDDTHGSYYVQLPDGRLQKVTFHVDGDNGYVANVEYSAEAQSQSSPESSKEYGR